jgi:GxxExxY protein
MNTDEHRDALTERIIACAIAVSNALGCGYLEKVYENAMFVALTRAGLSVRQQVPIAVKYEGVVVGDYCADLIVEDQVLLELKAVKNFDDVHSAQCINYLKASGLRICLLINFAKPKLEIRRIVQG